jgi:hypothetical protein
MNAFTATRRQLLPILKGATVSVTPHVYDLRAGRKERVLTDNFAELAVFPARQALKALSALPANWDGFGSDAPSGDAIGKALQLIVEMYRRSTQCAHVSWVNPHVSASEGGEVVFEWWKHDRKLTVYVSSRGAQYLRVGGPDIESDMDDGEIVGAQFVGLWLWLNA